MTSSVPDPDDDQLLFWRRHARAAAWVVAAAAVTSLLYVLLTLEEPNRVAMVAAIISLAGVAFLARMMPVELVVRARAGMLYMYAWQLIAVVAISVAAHLDGGATSPLSFLLFVVLVHGTTAYRIGGTTLVIVGVSSAYGWLSYVAGLSVGYTAVAVLVISMTGIVAAHAADNHLRAHAHEADLRRKLKGQTQRDSLTGCLNHQTFHGGLERAVSIANPDESLALLVIDIDNFKELNDEAGHLVGDDHLRILGEILQRVTRDGDLVGRVGGDEFAVALPGSKVREAEAIAERIRRDVKNSSRWEPKVSIGVAVAEQPTEARTLFSVADAALYQAKRGGRDQARVALPATFVTPATVPQAPAAQQ